MKLDDTTMSSPLPAIPVVDVRDGGPPRHALENPAKARALRDACLAIFPRAVRPLVPSLDRISHRWLVRSQSPYVPEIARIAAALDVSGVWLLNASMQWGCTSLACEQGGAPWLARTLDWPFEGLGTHTELARMRGDAGEFVSVTWPGYVGVLTGLAPGRFAIAINQAPLWRRTRRPWLRVYDIAANAVNTWRRVRYIPPDQLLRSVFESCRSFDEARRHLESVPVARPVIYTLAGCRAGELCVIERTEETHTTRFTATAAANDWLVGQDGWEARVGGDMVMNATAMEAAERSRNRRESLAGWNGSFTGPGFGWLVEPVLNRFTRVAMEMCPASGTLRVVGFETSPVRDGVDQATEQAVIDAAAA